LGILSTFIVEILFMKLVRLRVILMVLMAVLLFLAVSCTSQRYTTHQAPHPKRCNCPSFK